MKSTGIVRSIDELGRIVVPKEIRTKLGINPTDPIEIYVDEDKIILKKDGRSCTFCGGFDEIIQFKGQNICANCVRELNK